MALFELISSILPHGPRGYVHLVVNPKPEDLWPTREKQIKSCTEGGNNPVRTSKVAPMPTVCSVEKIDTLCDAAGYIAHKIWMADPTPVERRGTSQAQTKLIAAIENCLLEFIPSDIRHQGIQIVPPQELLNLAPHMCRAIELAIRQHGQHLLLNEQNDFVAKVCGESGAFSEPTGVICREIHNIVNRFHTTHAAAA